MCLVLKLSVLFGIGTETVSTPLHCIKTGCKITSDSYFTHNVPAAEELNKLIYELAHLKRLHQFLFRV